LEFLTIPDPATRLAMVKRGEVDIATLLQDVFYEGVKKIPSSGFSHPSVPPYGLSR